MPHLLKKYLHVPWSPVDPTFILFFLFPGHIFLPGNFPRVSSEKDCLFCLYITLEKKQSSYKTVQLLNHYFSITVVWS